MKVKSKIFLIEIFIIFIFVRLSINLMKENILFRYLH